MNPWWKCFTELKNLLGLPYKFYASTLQISRCMCVCFRRVRVKNEMILKFIWKNKWQVSQKKLRKRSKHRRAWLGLLHIKTYCENCLLAHIYALEIKYFKYLQIPSSKMVAASQFLIQWLKHSTCLISSAGWILE